MPYQATETIYSDQNPLDPDFNGRLLKGDDPDAAFVVTGKGGIVSDADAEKLGLVNNALANTVDLDTIARDADEKNKATYAKNKAANKVAVTPLPSLPSIGTVGGNSTPKTDS